MQGKGFERLITSTLMIDRGLFTPVKLQNSKYYFRGSGGTPSGKDG
jgi:hypothetical protein